jgi:transcriptional regulator with XRE-family HTH domain
MGQINPESWPDRQVLITRRLRQRRAELGLTQKQVVTRLGRCGLQTTNRAVSSLEHGAGVDVAKLPELALALDCTITYLIGLTDDPHRWEPDLPPGRQPGFRPGPVADSAPAPEALPAHSWILGLEVPDRPGRLAAGTAT